MKNMSVAILEGHETYGRRLASYLSCQENSPFNVELYLEHPVADDVWCKNDAVLITSSLYSVYRENKRFEHVVVLDEDGKKNEQGVLTVFKYQSAEVIYRTLLEFCMENSGKRFIAGGKSGNIWEVIGIYTPVRDETLFHTVRSICEDMGQNERVLYMNFEDVPLYHKFWDVAGKSEGLSELIYYVKQRHKNLNLKLKNICVNADFDYVMPLNTVAELDELSEEDWIYLIDCIRNETDYAYVVIDFGCAIPTMSSLGIYDKYLIITGNDSWEHQLVTEFRGILSKMLDGDIHMQIEEKGVIR